jgi:hypothetical protein
MLRSASREKASRVQWSALRCDTQIKDYPARRGHAWPFSEHRMLWLSRRTA